MLAIFAIDIAPYSPRNLRLSVDKTLLRGLQRMSLRAVKSVIIGTTAAAEDAGFQGFQNLLESYGLRIWNHDDVQEGKAILGAMGTTSRQRECGSVCLSTRTLYAHSTIVTHRLSSFCSIALLLLTLLFSFAFSYAASAGLAQQLHFPSLQQQLGWSFSLLHRYVAPRNAPTSHPHPELANCIIGPAIAPSACFYDCHAAISLSNLEEG